MADTATSVYLYFDALNVLIYVGITSRGPARQAEHASMKPWWPFVARQEVEHHPSREAASHRERELITQRTPPFNVQMNPHHEAVRAAYLQAVATADQVPPVHEVMKNLRRALPLLVVSHDDLGRGRPARLVLCTAPALAGVARITTLPSARARVLCDGEAVGEVAQHDYRGGRLWLTCTARRESPALREVRARLRVQLKPLAAEVVSVLATRAGGDS